MSEGGRAREQQEERYRVVRKLGEGGMGEVYLVEHLHLGRLEALKVLQPHVAADPHFVSRFRREARAMNRVQHPHIVGVHDFGRLPDGRFFLAMEYAAGERLDILLTRERRFAPPRALHVLEQLAGAVAYAHSQSVVHRDLKPSNLILAEHRGHHDMLKVLDFGLAKIIAGDFHEAVHPTRKGEILGTPTYMAPDQLAGAAADPRADIYAIGCIAYQLVTGSPPFVGNTSEIVEQHLTQAPEKPSARAPQAGVSPALEEVILRCLAKKPSQRYSDAGALHIALAAVPLAEPAGPKAQAQPGARDTMMPTVPRDAGHAHTQRLAPEDLRPMWRMAVRELAEKLIDTGRGSARLIVGLSRARRAEDEVERLIHEVSQRERDDDRIEQSAREREAPLSFAIGELEFERDRLEDALARMEIDAEILALENHVLGVMREAEAALGGSTERGIHLAAAKHDAEAHVASSYDDLARAVSEATQGTTERGLRPLIERLRSITGMLQGGDGA